MRGRDETLKSVRHLVRSGHMVVFDGEGSFICNKSTGEFNAINDDGINYNMDVWIVPPSQLQAVRQHVEAAEASQAGFQWPA